MKIIIILFVLFYSSSVFAEEFIYTCINNDTQFSTTYLVKTKDKYIHRIGSKAGNGTTYPGKKNPENIIFWEFPIVGTYNKTSAGIPTFKVYNFDNNSYNVSGHYDGDRLPYGQLFNCYKSQF